MGCSPDVLWLSTVCHGALTLFPLHEYINHILPSLLQLTIPRLCTHHAPSSFIHPLFISSLPPLCASPLSCVSHFTMQAPRSGIDANGMANVSFLGGRCVYLCERMFLLCRCATLSLSPSLCASPLPAANMIVFSGICVYVYVANAPIWLTPHALNLCPVPVPFAVSVSGTTM